MPRPVFAALLVVAIITTLGGSGHVLASTGPFALQARADALHARWVDMVAQGVPAADLEEMQREWAVAERLTIFSVGAV
jgi:hypothetical protein